MPTTLAVGDVVLMTVACYRPSQVALNDFHWQVAAIGGASLTDAAVALKLDATLAPLYKPLMNGDSTYYGVRLQRISPLPKPVAVVGEANTGVGTAVGAGLPGQVSGLMTLRTNSAGRAFRGRLYIPFPAASYFSSPLDTPTALWDTNVDAIAAILKNPYLAMIGADTVTLVPVIWHKATRTSTPIIDAESTSKFATQRRRGNYGRPNVVPPF
jgi:hypothetical protein